MKTRLLITALLLAGLIANAQYSQQQLNELLMAARTAYTAATSAPLYIYQTNCIIALNPYDESACTNGIYTNVAPSGWIDYMPPQMTGDSIPGWTNNPNRLVFNGATTKIGPWPTSDVFTIVGKPWGISAWISANYTGAENKIFFAGAFRASESTFQCARLGSSGWDAGGPYTLSFAFLRDGAWTQTFTTNVIASGVMVHTVMGWDGTNRFIYINGKLSGLSADSSGPNSVGVVHNYRLTLGAYYDNGSYRQTWKGDLSKPKFYFGHAITQADVDYLYATGNIDNAP